MALGFQATPQLNGPKRFPRFNIDFQLTAATAEGGAGPIIRGRSCDISIGGIGAVMLGELVEGQVVTLSFVLPIVHQRVRVRAHIKHRNGFRYGMEFLTLSAPDRKAIERLSDLLPQQMWQ